MNEDEISSWRYGCVWKWCTPKPNGFADHYPYEMAISLGILTQHFQTNPYIYWSYRKVTWMPQPHDSVDHFPTRETSGGFHGVSRSGPPGVPNLGTDQLHWGFEEGYLVGYVASSRIIMMIWWELSSNKNTKTSWDWMGVSWEPERIAKHVTLNTINNWWFFMEYQWEYNSTGYDQPIRLKILRKFTH